jgi:shikimate kinase/3-dehydroquinate synthase
MSPETRERIAASAVSVWLKADFDVLMRRVRKRSNRPLLANPDPEGTLRRLMAERYPVYGTADLTVHSRDVPHDVVVGDILQRLSALLMPGTPRPGAPAGDIAAMPTDAASPPAHETVHVALPGQPYDILIGRGVIGRAGEAIAALAPGAACAIVTDETVAKTHLATLEESLEAAGLRSTAIVVPPG